MPTPVYPRWTLRGLGEEELIVQPFEAPRPPGRELLSPQFPIRYLESRWLFERDARLVLIDIYTTLFGPLDLEPWAHDELHVRIGPALRSALMRRDLVVLAVRRRNASVPGTAAKVPSEPPPKKKDKTWIEVVLLDSDDKPVANAAYQITLPSGEKRTGRLDDKGFVRIDGIEEGGTCDVEFPEIDGREWGRSKFPKG